MTHLIVGLGNPGDDYAQTRHNIGQWVVEELAGRASVGLSRHKKAHAKAAQARLGGVGDAGRSVTLATPLSYMNLSGGPVSALASYVSADPENVVVIHDELDLPFGTVRLKRGGGPGGHNGVRDIIKALGSPEFVRVRVGIGRPPGTMDAADFVLRPFSATERKEVPFLVSDAADATEAAVLEGLEAAQQRFHTSQ